MRTGEPSAAPGWLDIEAAVEAFESAHARAGSADPAAFCPPPADPLHLPVAGELVRADLEFAARAGRPKRLDDYRAAFPALFADPAALAAVAFEEFRLRCQAGELVDPDEYRSRYGVDPSGWAAGKRSESNGSVGGRSGVTRLLAGLPPAAGPEAGRFPEPGAEVVGFRLARELGRGAFARVYLAEQADLAGRFVALKLSTRLVAEAQTLARLQHTNIVPVYSVHRVGRFHAVCMPYLGAATLADVLHRLRDQGSVPATAEGLVGTVTGRRADSTVPGDGDPDPVRPDPGYTGPLDALRRRSHVGAVLWIGAELADGLAHAHDRGVVHRDLKPANVLLTDEGRPMLLDFNLAADAGRAEPEVGTVGGTPSHMAPEQLAALAGAPATVDARSDLYALGVILYELLTGRPPHPVPPGRFREQLAELRVARSALPPPARAVNPAVTPAVDAILARCLAPDPAARYPSARHLHEDLAAHLDDRPLRHTPEPSVRERARKWARRNRWVKSVPFLAAVLLLAAGLGVGGYVYRTRHLERQLEAADAAETYRAFREEAAAARLRLTVRDPEPSRREAGVRAALAAVGRYGIPDAPDWEAAPRFARLDPDARTEVRAAAGELLVHLARMAVRRAAEVEGAGREAAFADADRWCAAAERVYPDDRGRATARWYAGEVRELAAGNREGNFRKRRRVPDGPAPLYVRATAGFDAGDYRGVVALLRAADPEEARNPVYWHLLGQCHDALGDGPGAVACYTAGIALQPADGDHFYFGRGAAHLRRNAFPEAAADLDAALRLRPDDPVVLRDRALARLGLKDYAGAVADLNRSEELDPGHTRVYFTRAKVYARSGDPAAARRQAEEGLKKTPGDELSWVARAQARRPRDPAGALADLDRAIGLNPQSLHGLQTKASVLAEDLGRVADAVAVLDRLVDAHPEYVPARAGRAVLNARLGRRDAAHADAAAVLDGEPAPFTRYQAAGVFALTSKTHPDDRKEALRLLASALRDKEGLAHVPTDHDLDPVRSDPEFGKLVEAARVLAAAPAKR
ncbi:MAG: hypothetical protein C0501_16090 [Isosphaera sp.]|nr:hypothetical protein [Isosphaera sp.]